MTAVTGKSWSYDAIADVYATDMGQSMPFDDVGWYRDLCLQRGGRTLELGCGTGRILIELLRSGIDAIGADRSLPMLKRLRVDAAKVDVAPALLQMDIVKPALSGWFRTILLPYSLITYVTDALQAAALAAELGNLLEPGGCLVFDAFVPQPVSSFADFRRDYRRPHGDGELERHKRITANADGTNRIERRYIVLARGGAVTADFSTDETIRPYTASDLTAFGEAGGLVVESCVWDYGQCAEAPQARFATIMLRRPNS
jgi:SAM-dependent methyltransferase